MQNIFLAFHIITCIVLIIMVLIQHGKGADQGLLSGGGSGSLLVRQDQPAWLLK